MKYKVIRIEEMDFGCEGMPDDAEPVVTVFLKNNEGNTHIIKHSDALLYKRNIDEGDIVSIGEDGTLYKE